MDSSEKIKDPELKRLVENSPAIAGLNGDEKENVINHLAGLSGEDVDKAKDYLWKEISRVNVPVKPEDSAASLDELTNSLKVLDRIQKDFKKMELSSNQKYDEQESAEKAEEVLGKINKIEKPAAEGKKKKHSIKVPALITLVVVLIIAGVVIYKFYINP